MQLCNFFIHITFPILTLKKKLNTFKHFRKFPTLFPPRVLKLENCVFIFESAYPPYKRQYQNFEFRRSFFVAFKKFNVSSFFKFLIKCHA